jgi:glycine cleavage system H protein
MYPDDLQYTEDHEWIRDDGGVFTVGITSFAAEQLGDVTYVELPELGLMVDAGQETAVVESVKAASDIYSPLTGEVLAVNDSLEDDPGIVNADPYGDGWLYSVSLADAGELEGLMDAEAYAESLEK